MSVAVCFFFPFSIGRSPFLFDIMLPVRQSPYVDLILAIHFYDKGFWNFCKPFLYFSFFFCYDGLVLFHKIMIEDICSKKELLMRTDMPESEICVEKMRLKVIHRHPIFSQKEAEIEKQKISTQLFQIFQKYQGR